MRKKLPIALFVLALLVSPLALATFYNPPDCAITGALDCWQCKDPRWGNVSFCWVSPEGATGQCGCVDFAPYAGCQLAGGFCSWIGIIG